uniref:Ig-like domain-containing protein n=1 Tax=Podarcis muralis TaxID=64176 RepID=A0A670K3Q9_PODMU
MRYWGTGTQVTVTTVPSAAPSLFPLIASPGSEGSEKVTIGCLAKNFLPDSVTFSWNNKNNVSDSTITSKKFPSVLGSGGTYTASSQALVPSADWTNYDPFYCKADHPSGNAVIRVIRGCETPEVLPNPEMSVRAPPIQAFFGSYLNATITCSVVNLPSSKYTLQWLKKGQVLDSGFTTTQPIREGRGYSIKSELIVTKRDWLSDITFSCAVNGKDFNDTLKINKNSFCEGGISCNDDVRVEAIPPSFADIFQTKVAKLTCRISNVPLELDLSALNVTWTKESDQTLLKTELGKPEDQANGLTYIDATATVCATEWDSDETFTCKVNFPGLLPEPIDKTLKKVNDGPQSTPAVYVLPPTSEELALRETATLTCLVKGFSPKGIFLQWLHNDQPVNSADFYLSEPKEEPRTQGKFFVYSILYISESDWSHGDRYTCVVGHEALPMNSTQKTVDKNTVYLDGIVDVDDEEFQNISSILSTFIILFLVSLFYSATVTVIKVK